MSYSEIDCGAVEMKADTFLRIAKENGESYE
jgi:hypothetical protein